MSDGHLYPDQMDKSLTVWGTAIDGRVIALGFGDVGHDLANELWDPQDPATGDIAYYHPDSGWTNAATGHPVELEDEWEQ